MFSNLKIIELSNILAGPAVGMFFAELGADVTKIENKKNGGDPTRQWKLPVEDQTAKTSAYFYSVNWGKKHIFFNYEDTNDLAAIKKLLSEADVVITNFKLGDDIKFGLDYPSIKKINEGIIYASISGFESDKDRVAFDIVLQAETGFMSMNGSIESGPVRMPVALIDLLAAHQMKEAILIALLKREKTKKGSCITVSLEKTAIASLANQASNYLNANSIAGLQGSLHPNIAPYGEIFETKDFQKIVLAIGTDKQFNNLCKILNLEEIVSKKEFSTNTQRVKNRLLLFDLLNVKIKEKSTHIFIEECTIGKVPAGIIKNIKEVLESELAKNMVIEENGSKRIATISFDKDFIVD
jgi:crotonobetainyl-CoA:carnitine CoA-transferase CaiB-like acyl-CoA transferase